MKNAGILTWLWQAENSYSRHKLRQEHRVWQPILKMLVEFTTFATQSKIRDEPTNILRFTHQFHSTRN